MNINNNITNEQVIPKFIKILITKIIHADELENFDKGEYL